MSSANGWSYPDLKRAAIEQCKLWSAKVVLIEDKASGTQLIQDLRVGEVPQVICRYFDRVDSTSQALEWIENGGSRTARDHLHENVSG